MYIIGQQEISHLIRQEVDVADITKKDVNDVGGGVGTRTQDMRVEAEWVIRNLTIVDGSLNRVSANHLGSTNNEAFGYSVAMSEMVIHQPLVLHIIQMMMTHTNGVRMWKSSYI